MDEKDLNQFEQTAPETENEQEQIASEPAETVFPEPEIKNNSFEFFNENEIEPVIPFSKDDMPPMQPINTQAVEKAAPASLGGLKVFCILLAAVIAFSGCIGVGYLIGKNSGAGFLSSGIPEKVQTLIDLKDPEDEDSMTTAQVYQKANPSVVGIITYNSAGSATTASGVIYTKDGYVITNDHIYSGVASPKFKIFTHDGKEYNAKFVGGDTRSDLAVLKITDTKSEFTPAEFADSTKLCIGQKVVAIGRPMDAKNYSNITQGIISLLDVRVSGGSNYTHKVIQTDTAINPGSSGGALFNMFGQVIGITSSKIVGSDYEGIGYAIPTTTVKKVIESLVEHGKVVNRAKLGISYQEIDSITAEVKKLPATGLYVADVTNADLTKVLTEGDIITHINGIAITSDSIVLDIIENALPGDSITLSVIKSNNSQKQFTAKLLADEGSSSLDSSAPTTSNNSSGSDSSSGSGPSFNFPFGE